MLAAEWPWLAQPRPRIVSLASGVEQRSAHRNPNRSRALDLAARQQVAPNLQDVRRLRLDKELDEQLALAG
jgi:hypothetical protein